MIDRLLRNKIEQKLSPNKAVLIFGARRVGKTMLIKDIMTRFNGKTLFLNGEDLDTLSLLENRSISNYKRLLQDINLFIMEKWGRDIRLSGDLVNNGKTYC